VTDQPGSPSDPTSSSDPTRFDPSLPSTAERIGPYRILSRIGEGGMGVVYLAEQEKPVRRRVALKVIKPGMDSRAVLARFEAERQALALMDHPGIARMLDAGTTPEGRPYFAMEHVPGVPLDSYCEKRRLDLDQRLRLFMEVCQAVLHAHQKAVLHRDLKPSNVLVADVEGRPVPKIIDFGLAKALGHSLTDKTLFTQQGLVVGTPEYMSPEQIDPSALAVDTRTDVYSLGVILYRLLTGTLPFSTESIRKAGHVGAMREIQSLICEVDAERPSSKVTSSHQVAEAAARSMRTPSASLIRRLRGDLDWIVLKSLEKDRNRRYATVTDLSEDVRRHLESEPVQARPPSAAYRLRKLVRKNTGILSALAALFVLLAAGVVTSTGFYLRSEEKRVEAEEARKEADLQRTAAIVAQGKEADQRRLAEEKERLAQEREREAVAARERETQEREKAELAQKEAERQRNEVLRLADIKRLQELVAKADCLWPAHPEKIPDMESWRNRARALAGNLETHRTSLLALRELAVEKPQEPETPDGGQQASGAGSDSGSAEGIDAVTDSGSEPDEASPPPSRWVFADTETQWRHDVLTELVAGLETFIDPDPKTGTIASVDERLVFARTVSEKTVEMYSVEWEEAIASIANEEECSAYEGLVIAPQVGLVPLGRDPASDLQEFAHVQTGEIPYRDQEGKLVIDRDTGIVFVLIPGGTFWMGAQKEDPEKPNYDPQARGNEGPVHAVTLSPFFVSKYEMTQEQWERFAGENPSYYQSGGLVPKPWLHPVEQVSWEDCQRVMERLGLLLPTEAQLEYGARAGTTTVWWTGAERDSLIGAANLADQAARRAGGTWPGIADWPELDDGFVVHAPVGSYRANAFGLHDVAGNVWEWCRDDYGGYDVPVAPGDGERQVSSRNRVNRGGSFTNPAAYARSALRDLNTPETRDNNLGLRPARVIDP